MSFGLWHQVSKDSMDLLARDDFMVCSDITPAGAFPHPRSYGAYPRFLGRLQRQYTDSGGGCAAWDSGRPGNARAPVSL
jgi:hypothetical protein